MIVKSRIKDVEADKAYLLIDSKTSQNGDIALCNTDTWFFLKNGELVFTTNEKIGIVDFRADMDEFKVVHSFKQIFEKEVK